MAEPLTRRLFGAPLFLLALSGFAQMPIMKRYYIADVPGLAWLADYSITSLLHYIAAAGFLFLCGLVAARHLADPARPRLPGLGLVRLGLYLLVILSGLAHVVHNTASWPLPPALAQTAVLGHLAGVMGLGLLFVSRRLAALAGRRR